MPAEGPRRRSSALADAARGEAGPPRQVGCGRRLPGTSLVAVTALHATPGQVGLLAALSTASFRFLLMGALAVGAAAAGALGEAVSPRARP
jgi:hypothetical protein